MTTLAIVSTAYERKAELGGGFRGVVLDKRTGERFESDVLESVQAARFYVRSKVNELMGDQSWRPGYIYRPDWRMNVWTR